MSDEALARAKKRIEKLKAQVERYKRPLLSFIETVEATGGVTKNLDPVGDPTWHDIGEAYVEACNALGARVHYQKAT